MLLNRISAVAILASFLIASTAFGQELKDEDPSWQHYTRVLRDSTLEYWATEPFLLKIEYQLYDLDGKPAQKGIAELSWGNGKRAVHIQSPSLDVKEPREPGPETNTHVRENYLVTQVLGAVARPFPTVVKRTNFVMTKFQPDSDPVSTDCFALVPPEARTPDTSAYCTDQDNHLTTLTGVGPFILRRSNFRKYRNREVPLDIELSYGGKLAMMAHVTELDVLQQENNPTSASAKNATAAIPIPSAVVAGLALKKKSPSYPKEARKKHIEGTVILWALITKEGVISNLDVIASPDSLLSKSATDAVQKWTYKPYLLNETPVEVDTTIIVKYALGS